MLPHWLITTKESSSSGTTKSIIEADLFSGHFPAPDRINKPSIALHFFPINSTLTLNRESISRSLLLTHSKTQPGRSRRILFSLFIYALVSQISNRRRPNQLSSIFMFRWGGSRFKPERRFFATWSTTASIHHTDRNDSLMGVSLTSHSLMMIFRP